MAPEAVHIQYSKINAINDKSEHNLSAHDQPLQKTFHGFRQLEESPPEQLLDLEANANFWWYTTGSILSTLLGYAGYGHESHFQRLQFFHQYICPSLGARPTNDGRPRVWQSFMTDDHSPLEFSWNWGNGGSQPKVRFSIEALGHRTGTTSDPHNQAKALDLIDTLRAILPDTDWTLFDTLSEVFWEKAPMSDDYRTTVFLGFELDTAKTVVKAYFFPGGSGRAKSLALSQIVGTFAGPLVKSSSSALDKLLYFLRDDAVGSLLRTEMVAIDCVARSRLKIYVRSANTSFDSVRAVLTMNGELCDPEMKRSLLLLDELWRLTLGLDEGFPTSQPLPEKQHRTSGVLFYFDSNPESGFIEPKVYIPVRHYARNDREIAKGLAAFLRARTRVQDGHICNYLRALERICTYRTLESSCGLQTYISCNLKHGSLGITSYLSPEIYHPARWKNSRDSGEGPGLGSC